MTDSHLQGHYTDCSLAEVSDRDIYRNWQGSYRFLYQIKDDMLLIVVAEIGSRGSVFK